MVPQNSVIVCPLVRVNFVGVEVRVGGEPDVLGRIIEGGSEKGAVVDLGPNGRGALFSSIISRH